MRELNILYVCPVICGASEKANPVLSIRKHISCISDTSSSSPQIGHSSFSYDGNGDLVKSEFNLDFIAFFAIALGFDPESYAPEVFYTNSYVSSNSPNPLAGSFSFTDVEYSIMKNLPVSITITDIDGNVTSDNYEFEFDEHGNCLIGEGWRDRIKTIKTMTDLRPYCNFIKSIEG